MHAELQVGAKADAPYLQEGFDIKQECKGHINRRSANVWDYWKKCVYQNADEDAVLEVYRENDLTHAQWGMTFAGFVVDRNEMPSRAFIFDHLGRQASVSPPHSPFSGGILAPDVRKCFRHHRDEHILNEPRYEKYQQAEVDNDQTTGLEAHHFVHDQYPAFLGRALINRQETVEKIAKVVLANQVRVHVFAREIGRTLEAKCVGATSWGRWDQNIVVRDVVQVSTLAKAEFAIRAKHLCANDGT